MNKKKTSRRSVKAWAVVSNGEILIKFDHAHSVFTPRIYSTAEGARNVARLVWKHYNAGVVPCTISYTLPIPKRKKK